MKCPYCEKEMEKGKMTFIVQGVQVILSYTSDEEQKKGFLKRKAQEMTIFSGKEAETFFCPSCEKIIPVLSIK